MKTILYPILILCFCSACKRTDNYFYYIKYSVEQRVKERRSGPLKEYAVSFIDIDNPIVVEIKNRYYVMPDTTINAYKGNDSIFINRKDVLRCNDNISIDPYYVTYKLYKSYALLIGDVLQYLQKKEIIENMAIYEFKLYPKYFLLSLQQNETNISEDDVVEYEYSKEYYPVVCPVYSIRSLKEYYENMGEKWY